ncbi:MAG: DNA polymerase III subunit delta [Rhizobiaceae bacterium]|nr:DNA polymerase III subunit delta [Rhizobiaceae bacterium]
MTELKAKDVDAYVRAGPRHGVILVYGPDRGAVSERAAQLAKAWGVALDDPFAAVRLDGQDIEADPPRLADEARTVSMFGGKRLVWVRGTGGAKLAAAVTELAQGPLADCLILIEAGELKKEAALRKAAERAAGAVTLPCYADEGRGLDALIDEVMGANRLGLELDARQWLKQRLGGDRLASRGELEKLALYCTGQPRVTLDDARAAIGDVSGLSIDAIIEAVLGGRQAALDLEFSKLAATKTPAFVVLSALTRQFLGLMQLREQVELGGRQPSGLVAAIKPPLFGARRTMMEQALATWTLADLGRALDRLSAATLESRRIAVLDDAIIRQTLLALTSLARKSAR